jgi:hypothetical protein
MGQKILSITENKKTKKVLSALRCCFSLEAQQKQKTETKVVSIRTSKMFLPELLNVNFECLSCNPQSGEKKSQKHSSFVSFFSFFGLRRTAWEQTALLFIKLTEKRLLKHCLFSTKLKRSFFFVFSQTEKGFKTCLLLYKILWGIKEYVIIVLLLWSKFFLVKLNFFENI